MPHDSGSVRLSPSFVQRTANKTLFSSKVAVVFGGVFSLFALARDGWTSHIEILHQNCIVILFAWSLFTLSIAKIMTHGMTRT
jgi:hypothetical protein